MITTLLAKSILVADLCLMYNAKKDLGITANNQTSARNLVTAMIAHQKSGNAPWPYNGTVDSISLLKTVTTNGTEIGWVYTITYVEKDEYGVNNEATMWIARGDTYPVAVGHFINTGHTQHYLHADTCLGEYRYTVNGVSERTLLSNYVERQRGGTQTLLRILP